jgi:hypothetical protein
MIRSITLPLLALTLATLLGCSTPAVVYSPKDGPDDAPSGAVQPLGSLLGGATSLRLVLVHGVGDHCPGYALDPQDGWLNSDAMQAMGLRSIPSDDTDVHPVDVSVFMGGKFDGLSQVAYAKRKYALKLPGSASDTSVEAIEITWSPLTQWIKSNQLGYDSPSTTPQVAQKSKGCPPPADPTHPPGKAAPPRLFLDKLIKEQIFDRNLSDAILYSGTYGWVMERGIAEALCRAINPAADDAPCAWQPEEQDKYKYIFVTHSLGSRMVYDMFLDLLGRQTAANKNPFSTVEIQRARLPVGDILTNTPAFYMMANQVSLLGLSDVPKTARSSDGMVPYALYIDLSGALPKDLGVLPAASKPGPSRADPSRVFGDVFSELAAARKAAAAQTLKALPKLQIVAFNDTNDLLTWHIPPWYGVSSTQSETGVEFVNVFVQNTPKLIVIENPGPAHDNYFKKKDVWEVISCGAESGAVRPCPK